MVFPMNGGTFSRSASTSDSSSPKKELFRSHCGSVMWTSLSSS